MSAGGATETGGAPSTDAGQCIYRPPEFSECTAVTDPELKILNCDDVCTKAGGVCVPHGCDGVAVREWHSPGDCNDRAPQAAVTNLDGDCRGTGASMPINAGIFPQYRCCCSVCK